MNELLQRIKKASKLDYVESLEKSKIYNQHDMVDTGIPALNIALSGDIDGGIIPGLTVIAGPSKHFKSAFAMIMAAAYQNKYPEGIIMFYDSEFGIPEHYLKTFGIDKSRVLHCPIGDIEQFKQDIVRQLKETIKRGDKVCIIVDSIGNLASKKEIDDAVNGKSVADMSRAKALKSLFRSITPFLIMNDIPMIAINHVYKEIGMFPMYIVSGGTGVMLSSNNVWIVGRQQEKNKSTNKIDGYHFIINVEKSRFLREKSKIPVTVLYDSGINKWSGLFEIAVEGGYLVKSGNSYVLADPETGEVIGEKMTEKSIVADDEFWESILENTDFKQYVKKKYQLDKVPTKDELLSEDPEEVEEDDE